MTEIFFYHLQGQKLEGVLPALLERSLERGWKVIVQGSSEERIDGKQFDMVAHLVHKDVGGRLAVVAVLLERGAANPMVQLVWNNLPLEKGE